MKDKNSNPRQEVNMKVFLQKMYKNIWLFVMSIGFFMLLAFVYIMLATPKYEVATSLLIDSSGSNRVLGDSKYVDGGVSLIEMEKNLYNEISIIQSYDLVKQTLDDLGFDVTYHSKNWIKQKEHYGHFPIQVKLTKSEPQLIGTPIFIEILSNEKFQLSIEASEYAISDPVKGSSIAINRNLDFSGQFSFGERISNDYFDLTVQKSDDRINLADFGDLSFNIRDLDALANDYIAKLKVENVDLQASILKVTSQGPLVEKEADFLKRLTQNYVQSKLDSRNNIASTKESFIRNQLKIVSDSLSKMEAELELFKRDKRALDLGATANNALGRTSNLQVEKAKIELDIKYYNELIQNVNNNLIGEDFVIPTAAGIADPLINDNIIELKELYALKSKKKFFVTSNNEEMKVIERQIRESTSLLLNNLHNAIRTSEFSLARINSQLDSYDGLISSLPEKENQLLTIERKSTLYENLFNYLSQELAKTGIAGAENTSDTRVLDEARMVGDGPIFPQKMLLLTLAMILGVLLPLIYLVWFSPNNIIHGLDQIVDHTDIPVIACIATHDPNNNKPDSHVARWKVKESFRDLSANLSLYNANRQSTVIGVVSIMPEEGKTFCAINSGIALAEAGKKTIVIDADLRNPSLVKELNKIEGKGLSNYLQGEIDNLKDIIHEHDQLTNLHFIPTSVLNISFQKLLSGEKLNELVRELKTMYDYIIFDSAPIGLVSDYLFLSELIDVNLFVVRRNLAKIEFLQDFAKLVETAKNGKSYIVFNDTLEKENKYGYEKMYGVNSGPQLIADSLTI
ncbi:GumC family protein [Maribacter algicola]|uniref:GumC family protein n=1 Tax=Meishania litoralis TaxID=3434685 RepID=A0ACC7LJG0_9FLAO